MDLHGWSGQGAVEESNWDVVWGKKKKKNLPSDSYPFPVLESLYVPYLSCCLRGLCQRTA